MITTAELMSVSGMRRENGSQVSCAATLTRKKLETRINDPTSELHTCNVNKPSAQVMVGTTNIIMGKQGKDVTLYA